MTSTHPPTRSRSRSSAPPSSGTRPPASSIPSRTSHTLGEPAADGGVADGVAVPAPGSQNGQDPAAAAATSAAPGPPAGAGALAALRLDADAGARAGVGRVKVARAGPLDKAIADKMTRAKRKADQDEADRARETSAPAGARPRVPRVTMYSPTTIGALPQRSSRKPSAGATKPPKKAAPVRALAGGGAGAKAGSSSALPAAEPDEHEPDEHEPARGLAAVPAQDSLKSWRTTPRRRGSLWRRCACTSCPLTRTLMPSTLMPSSRASHCASSWAPTRGTTMRSLACKL